MRIDSYQFGEIVIDGKAYHRDVIIVDGLVKANWWRAEGHLLSVGDIKSVIAAKPSILIVGCGTSGLMKVDQDVHSGLSALNIRLEVFDTYQAVKRLNELWQGGINAAAALHLTC
ncbi:MAG: hypothetical protein JXB29_07460 [Sedimentisphaerales bacterium]|nr:hypothetical protein [Sedimentisphaerales bacterium]